MFCGLHVCIKKSSGVFTISHRPCLPHIGSLILSHQTLKWFCRHVKMYCEGKCLVAYLVKHGITFTMIMRQKNHSHESISCKAYYQGWTYSFSFLPMCLAKNISCLGLWQPTGISPTDLPPEQKDVKLVRTQTLFLECNLATKTNYQKYRSLPCTHADTFCTTIG